jgi:hypothetical protein
VIQGELVVLASCEDCVSPERLRGENGLPLLVAFLMPPKVNEAAEQKAANTLSPESEQSDTASAENTHACDMARQPHTVADPVC